MSGYGSGIGAEDDETPMIVDINVTPLVDITMVLLIIFMVTATHIVKRGLPIDLPTAASATVSPILSLSVQLDKNGALRLNGAAITEEDLVAAVKGALRSKPDIEASIAADKSISHGQVVHVMDLVRTAGVRKFVIQATRAAR